MLGAYGTWSVAVGASHALEQKQSQDLAPLYMAARLWRLGHDPYLERAPADWQRITGAREVPDAPIDRAYSTPYPPIALLVVAGTTGLEWPDAKVSWLVLNLALAIYVPWLVQRLWLPGRSPLAIAAFYVVWFGGIGLRVGLGNGQHALFWLAAMLTVIWLLMRHRQGWGGVPLALSLYKYPLTAWVLPYLLAHRWFRLLGVGALGTAAALALFAANLQVSVRDVFGSFVRELGWWYSRTDAGRLDGGITEFHPVLAAVLAPDAAAIATYLLIGAATVAACWPVSSKPPIPRGIDVAAVLLLMLVATYHRVYDTIVLIVPLAVFAGAAASRTGWRRGLLGAVVALLVMVWYADPWAVYRRVEVFALDQRPGSPVFVALDHGYRVILAIALVVAIALRFRGTAGFIAAGGRVA